MSRIVIDILIYHRKLRHLVYLVYTIEKPILKQRNNCFMGCWLIKNNHIIKWQTYSMANFETNLPNYLNSYIHDWLQTYLHVSS
jgi:hypothetical protein